MVILLLCCATLLSGCGRTQALQSSALFEAPPWPEPVNIEKQSGVAKYITRAHSSYSACVANLDALREIMVD